MFRKLGPVIGMAWKFYSSVRKDLKTTTKVR